MFKKLWNNKILLFWLWILVSTLLPIAIVMNKYNFGEMSTVKQVGFPVLIVIFWALIRFWSSINEAVVTMKEGFTREILNGVMSLGPYLLLFFIGFGINMLYKDYMYIVTVMLLTQSLGLILEARHSQLKRKDLADRGYVNVIPN